MFGVRPPAGRVMHAAYLFLFLLLLLLGGGARGTAIGRACERVCTDCQLPPAEVCFLQDFYEGTHGEYWLSSRDSNDGWKAAADAGWDPQSVNPCPDPPGSTGTWAGIGNCEGVGGPKPWKLGGIDMYLNTPGMKMGCPDHCAGNNVTGHLPSFAALTAKVVNIQIGGPVISCTQNGDPAHPGNDGCIANVGQLSGTLPAPPSGGNLQVFTLENTRVSGTIPAQYAGAEPGCSLQNLKLMDNQLSGNVPWDAIPCPNLRELKLGGNRLSGTLSAGLFNQTTSLEYVDLEHTRLAGKLPALPPSVNSLMAFSSLFTGFAKNQGPLPELREVDVNENMMRAEDSFPFAQLNGSNKLTLLHFAGNQMQGTLPDSLRRLTSLTDFWMQTNSFTGEITEALCDLVNLENLWISANKFEGTIPECLSKLTKLEGLWLNDNRLLGTLPAALGRLTKLTQFPLGNNRFTGTIPSSFGNLINLPALEVADNRLTISDSLDAVLPKLASKLTKVCLSRNLEIKSLPTTLATLTKLNLLEMSSPNLTKVHLSLDNLHLPASVKIVDLSHNNFAGSAIPNHWQHLEDLEALDLTGCQVNANFSAYGDSPDDPFRYMKSLTELRLGSNNFTAIPFSLFRMKLQIVDFSHNQINIAIDTAILNIAPGLYRDGSYRDVDGDIESFLQILDLSNNAITGFLVPNMFSSVFALQQLTNLDLHNNNLTGSFPQIFTPGKRSWPLYSMNINNNDIEGYLPSSLKKMQALRHFDATNNTRLRKYKGVDSASTAQLNLERDISRITARQGDAGLMCPELKSNDMPDTSIKLDPEYLGINENGCYCKVGFIRDDQGNCVQCDQYTTTDNVTVLDCKQEKTAVLDGFYPFYDCAHQAFPPLWHDSAPCASSNSTTAGLKTLAQYVTVLVRCPVLVKSQNPCTGNSKAGQSVLSTWECAPGYTGPACIYCNISKDDHGRQSYGRELGSRVCIKCDDTSRYMPWIYLFLMMLVLIWLILKDVNDVSNLGSSFIFYFQSMTLIKRSILPWDDGAGLWMSMTAILNLNPALSGCVSYLHFLEDAEKRHWFKFFIPVYIVMICVMVWLIGISWDAGLSCCTRRVVTERLTASARHYRFTVMDRDTQGNALTETLKSLSPRDRAIKLMFALFNISYLPLCFLTFGGSRWATADYEFVGDQSARFSGKYLLNAPTIGIPSHAATRMNAGFWAGLVLYTMMIPAVIYLKVYRPLVSEHTDGAQGETNVASRLVQTCGVYFMAYRDGSTIGDQVLSHDPGPARTQAQAQAPSADASADDDSVLRGTTTILRKRPKDYRWWPLMIVLPRRVFFTAAVAFFAPEDPKLPVCVFVILLVALLLQFRHRPLKGKLDNLLEEVTLGLLLVCFTLAQVMMADGHASEVAQTGVSQFVGLAKVFDGIVIATFASCLGLRKLLQRSPEQRCGCLAARRENWARSESHAFVRRVLDVIEADRSTSSSMDATRSVRALSDLQQPLNQQPLMPGQTVDMVEPAGQHVALTGVTAIGGSE